MSVTNRNKLATLPLAVLLPQLGNLSALPQFIDALEVRLQLLHADEEVGTDGDVRKRLGEEAMLMQVINWLGMGEDKESA